MSQNIAISLQFIDKRHQAQLKSAQIKRWVQHALAPQVQQAELSFRFVGQTEGRALNLQYRGKDYATNVLTFDYSQAPVLHADIVICAPVVAAEAKAEGKTLLEHYAHLITHGALHAQGYDHELHEADADEMETLEMLLLLSQGLPNPY